MMKLLRYRAFYENSLTAPYDDYNGGSAALTVTLRSLGDLSDYRLSGLNRDRIPDLGCKVGDRVRSAVYDGEREVEGKVTRIVGTGVATAVYVKTDSGEELRVEPFDMDILGNDPNRLVVQTDNEIQLDPNSFGAFYNGYST